jgi:hypothetical protein
MERLAAEDVTVLDRAGRLQPSGAIRGSPIVDVDGLSAAGFPDPLEWQGAGDPPDRPVTFDDLPDPEAAFERASNELVDWFDDQTSPPDVVMVHQNGLAQRLAASLFDRGHSGELTIVTGHTHQASRRPSRPSSRRSVHQLDAEADPGLPPEEGPGPGLHAPLSGQVALEVLEEAPEQSRGP